MPDEVRWNIPFVYKVKFHDLEDKTLAFETAPYNSADMIGAFLGTSGTPSNTNRFVTNSDSRNLNAREPVAHNSAFHLIVYPTNTLYYTHVDNAVPHTVLTGFAVNTDSRFTDAREPTAHNSSFHSVGYLSNTAPYAVNTDLRFTDARNPVAHNSVLHSVLYAPIAANGYVAPTQLGLSPTGTLFLRGDNTWQTPGGGTDPWTYLTLATEFRTPLSAGANVSTLSFTPSANLKYEVEGSFYVKTDTALTSPQPGIGWPTGMACGVAQVAVTASNSTTILGVGHLGDAIKAVGTGLPVTTNYYPASLWAIMTAGASPTGIFRVTLASETNATNVYMGVDSFLKYRTYT